MSKKNLKILIIDDEVRICKLIDALIDWGSLSLDKIGFAHDGLTGLDMIRQYRPDIVITDIRMPGIEGIDLIRTVRAEKIDSEFIIISGFSEFEYAQSAVKMNVVDYILKPIKEEELNNTLKEVSQRILKKNKVRDISYEIELEEQLKKNDLTIINSLKNSPNEYYSFYIVKKDSNSNLFNKMMDNKDIIIGTKGEGIIKANTYSKAHRILSEYSNISGLRFLLYDNYKTPHHNDVYDGIYSQDKIFSVKQHAFDQRKISKLEDINRYINSSLQILDKNLVKENIKLYFSLLRKEPFLPGDTIQSLFNSMMHKLNTTMIEQKYSYEFLSKIEYIFQGYYSIDIIEEHLAQVLNDAIDEIKREKTNQLNPIIYFIDNYIESNYMESISLDEIAHELEMNASYLSNLYRKETHRTFKESLTSVRIEKSKELLRTTNIPITEICIMVGYNDQKHFTSTFKKLMKINPSQYRKLNQNENILYL